MAMMIISSPGYHPANDKNRIQSIQMSSRWHQLLPMAAGDHRTLEKSRLHLRTCQFTAETSRTHRWIGTQGTSLTLKTMIMSMGQDQLSPITSPSTYNGGSDLTLNNAYWESRRSQTIYKSAQSRLHFFQYSKVHLSQFACTPTALATSKKPTCRSILQPTYGYSYLGRGI